MRPSELDYDPPRTGSDEDRDIARLVLPNGMVPVSLDWLADTLLMIEQTERQLEKLAEYPKHAAVYAEDRTAHDETVDAIKVLVDRLHLARLWVFPRNRVCHHCGSMIRRMQDAKLLYLGTDFAPEMKHCTETDCRPIVLDLDAQDDATGFSKAA